MGFWFDQFSIIRQDNCRSHKIDLRSRSSCKKWFLLCLFVCLFVCLLMVVLWITVGVVAADEWLFRLRWKIHLSFSSWTTRSASSAPAAVLSWAMASLAIQPRRLAHVGHWCWANFSKFFIMDSRLSWDSGDSASPTSLSRRLDNVGDPGKDRLFVSRASSNSWLHKRM